MSLSVRLGLRRAAEPASLLLKCVPLRLRSRNCSNFFCVACGGEPGGEGGMSKSGLAGRVRFRNSARLVEYGDRGGWLSASGATSKLKETASDAGGRLGPGATSYCWMGAITSGSGSGGKLAAGAGVSDGSGFSPESHQRFGLRDKRLYTDLISMLS